jgi:hypothetical protein
MTSLVCSSCIAMTTAAELSIYNYYMNYTLYGNDM